MPFSFLQSNKQLSRPPRQEERVYPETPLVPALARLPPGGEASDIGAPSPSFAEGDTARRAVGRQEDQGTRNARKALAIAWRAGLPRPFSRGCGLLRPKATRHGPVGGRACRPGLETASALRAAAQHAGAPAANRDVSSAGGGRCCLLAEGFVHLSRRNTVPLRLTRAIKIPRPRIEARARHNPRSPASHGLLNKPAQCSRPRAPGTLTAAQRTAYGRLVTTSSYGPVHPSS